LSARIVYRIARRRKFCYSVDVRPIHHRLGVREEIVAVEQRTRVTVEEFARIAHDSDKRFELIDGEVIEMSPSGTWHGFDAGEAISLIGSHVRQNNLGFVSGAEAGFTLGRNPGSVRAPDVAYVSWVRLPNKERQPGFLEVVPDLV